MKSNFLSYHLRKVVEKFDIKKIIGFQLASTLFLAAVTLPQINLASSIIDVNQSNNQSLLTDHLTQLTFIWPLENAEISQGFRFFHPAIDLAAAENTPVFAMADGLVTKVVNSNWGYGNYLIIQHHNHYFSLYAHLDKILVKEKSQVKQQTVIATVGKSGWASGYHLHLEIRGPEGVVNPLEVLPKKAIKTLSSD